MSTLTHHFRIAAGPRSANPRPASSGLFRRPATAADASLTLEVQQLSAEVAQQGSQLGQLAGVVAGHSASEILGGSVLGGAASLFSGGFSWKSLLRDVLPLGGLVSDIAGLFGGPAPLAPLDRYDAPVSLNFSGVLGADGGIEQAAGDVAGRGRAVGPLSLLDAGGGPRSPYARRPDGSLGAAAGDPSARYAGVLDLSSVVAGLVQPPSSAPPPTSPSFARPIAPLAGAGDGGQSRGAAEAAAAVDNAAEATPSFDGPWFMDHAPYIAAAVRSAMLDSHPVVDVINDL